MDNILAENIVELWNVAKVQDETADVACDMLTSNLSTENGALQSDIISAWDELESDDKDLQKTAFCNFVAENYEQLRALWRTGDTSNIEAFARAHFSGNGLEEGEEL